MLVAADTDFLIRLAVAEHPGRGAAVKLRDRLLDAGDLFALAPQVLAEFVHVATDGRRFERPLSVEDALTFAGRWWEAPETQPIFPVEATYGVFDRWMRERRLGRKRILDTMLAATCFTAGVSHLITGNSSDFRIFEDLTLIELPDR